MYSNLATTFVDKNGKKIKIWQTDKSGKSFKIDGASSSTFFGSYPKLVDKLKADGYVPIRHEAVEIFVDRVIEEALKPGQKMKVKPTIDIKLSKQAKAAIVSDPTVKSRVKKIEDEVLKLMDQRHVQWKILVNSNSVTKLNAARTKRLDLDRQIAKLEKEKNTLIVSKFDEADAKYFSLIEKECSKFLVEVKKANKFLYRGMDNDHPVVYGRSHEKRDPKDTSERTQKEIDKILSDAGFKALRSNSIFTTGDYGRAGGYGDVYIIFPRNGYNFTWSTKHKDWVPHESDTKKVIMVGMTGVTDNAVEEIDRATDDTSIEDYLTDFDDNDKIIDAKLKKIINNPTYKQLRHLLLNWDDYDSDEPNQGKKAVVSIFKTFAKLEAAVNMSFPIGKRYRTAIDKFLETEPKSNGEPSKEVIDKFMKSHGFKNTDMADAIKSKREIYINGEYIALNYEEFNKRAAKYFLGNTKL